MSIFHQGWGEQRFCCGPIGKIVSALTGIGTKAPSVSTAPIDEVTDDQKKAKGSRSALFETPGGIQGEELAPGQVAKRPSLLGN